MKNSILKTKLLLMLLGIVLMLSCSTEDGEDGAIGPQGIAGVDGVDGADGQDGNANVISSDWIPFEESTWGEMVTIFGVDQRLYPVVVPEVTPDISNTAAFLGYITFDTTPTSYSLAFTEAITAAGATGLQTMSMQIQDDGFDIRIMNSDGQDDPGTFGSIGQFRYVIIPAATADKTNHPDFSKMTYEEVMDYFNLEY